MRRRDFIKGIVSAAPLWPRFAHAQQNPVPVIGFMGAESLNLYTDRLNAFQDGLKEIGFVEGQNVAVEYRWAERQYNRYPARRNGSSGQRTSLPSRGWRLGVRMGRRVETSH
jgi:putative ABC transport system substrate-binding protein